MNRALPDDHRPSFNKMPSGNEPSHPQRTRGRPGYPVIRATEGSMCGRYPRSMDVASPAPAVCTPWFLTAPPPQVRETLITRPRLHDRITFALDAAGLVVIAAPPGHGKTVLLNSWMAERDGACAWLTLTSHEASDEILIASAIVAALDELLVADVVEPERAQPGPVYNGIGSRGLLGRIADLVASLPGPVTLVIDDAHHAGPVLGDQIVNGILALTGDRLRLVIAGHPGILRWFHRWVIDNPTIVLAAADLAMTTDEVIRFAARGGEQLDRAEADARQAATGGWPIALRFSTLVSQSSPSDGTWRDSFLVDFIEDDVLPSLPVRLREFILSTTTTARFDVNVARAISGDPGAGSLLDECLVSGLFIERVGDGPNGAVYRWHDAFSEACRRVVLRASPRRSRSLNATAAGALAAEYPVEALLHAARADDPELSLDILRRAWLRVLIESGARPLLAILQCFPEDLAMTPEVGWIRACCLDLLGDHEGARILSAMAAGPTDDECPSSLTRAFANLFLIDDRDELLLAVEQAHQIMVERGTDRTMFAYRVFLLGWTLLRLRANPGRAAQLLRSAMEEARRGGRQILEARANANLRFALAYGGRFAAAEALDGDGSALDHHDDVWSRYDGGIGVFALGFVAFWGGRFDEAAVHLHTLIATDGHDESYAALGRVFLALIAAASGDRGAIRGAHAQVDRIGRAERHGVPWPVYRAAARAALFAADGDAGRALALVSPLRDQENVPVIRVVGAEIARRAGDATLAALFLSGLHDREREVSYIGVSALTTTALLAYQRGDRVAAHRAIETALDVAARNGVVSPLTTSEPLLRDLLSAHAVAGSHHREFIAARLAELESVAVGFPGPTALSSREKEVLAHLRTPMTASEIAAALFVSVNTVRTHQRSIYRKLGVTSRRDAVAASFTAGRPRVSPGRTPPLCAE